MGALKYYDTTSGTWKYVTQGPKGEKGDTGAPGPKGDTGEQGEQGIKGDEGRSALDGFRELTGNPEATELDMFTALIGERGDNGVGISSIGKTATNGLIDTYKINYTDGSTSMFNITNGNGISDIIKTNTTDLLDTYRINYTNGSYATFRVTNGADGTTFEYTPENVANKVTTISDTSTDTEYPSAKAVNDTFIKSDGSSSDFLKADGSVGNAIEIVDTYADLPSSPSDGEQVMVLNDTMVEHITPTMVLDTEYGVIYTKPVIHVEDFGLEEDYAYQEYKMLSFTGSNADWDIEIYPNGDELIDKPYMLMLSVTMLEYIDDGNMTFVQTMYMYNSQEVEFWIVGNMVTLKAGWTKLSVKIKLFAGVYNPYDFMINFDQPPAFEEVTFNTENSEDEEEAWDNIQNMIFDQTNFARHASGIYRYCETEGEWCLVMQSSNFKPEPYMAGEE